MSYKPTFLKKNLYNTPVIKYLSMNKLLRANLLVVHVCFFYIYKAGIISLLDEEEPQLKVAQNIFIISLAIYTIVMQIIYFDTFLLQEFALHKLNSIVNDFWAEISGSVDKM